jgi:hypothetical protein
MRMRTLLNVATVVVLGLLAGLVLGTGMAQFTALQLPPGVWILRHQAEDSLFRQVMPPWWSLAVLLPAVAAFVNRGAARTFFVLAAVVLAIAMALTITHEVPINRMVQHWSATNPPAEVDHLRHSWMTGHWGRTALTFVGFVLSVLGLVQSSPCEQRS